MELASLFESFELAFLIELHLMVGQAFVSVRGAFAYIELVSKYATRAHPPIKNGGMHRSEVERPKDTYQYTL